MDLIVCLFVYMYVPRRWDVPVTVARYNYPLPVNILTLA